MLVAGVKYTEPTAVRRRASRGVGAKSPVTSHESAELGEKSNKSITAAAESDKKLSADAASETLVAQSSDVSEQPSTDSAEQLVQQLYTTPLCVFLPICLFVAFVE